jgi:hypothetical protein
VFARAFRRLGSRRLLTLAGVLVAVVVLNPGGKVSAAMASVAESIGLHDESDNLRARIGAQDDGKYGLRVWDASGNQLYDFTDGGEQVGFTPRTATTVAGLGTGMKDGEVGYLHLGTGSLNSVPVTWDDTRSQWVTNPQPLVSLVGADPSTTSTTYVAPVHLDTVRQAVPGLKDLWDAGLRPEVYFQAQVFHTGAGTSFAEALLFTTSGTQVGSGGEVSTTSTSSTFLDSDWTPLTGLTAPTVDYGYGEIDFRSTAGTTTLVSSITNAQIRWAG